MKTTVELPATLLRQARRHARLTGRPVRTLIEKGLRLVLDAERAGTGYQLPDRSVGEAGGVNPLDARTWQELRREIYGDG